MFTVKCPEEFANQTGKYFGNCTRSGSTKRLSNSRLSPHARYLEAYKFIHRKDKELGQAFNDLRRSTALWQIRIIYGLGLVTDTELAKFTDATRNFVLTEF